MAGVVFVSSLSSPGHLLFIFFLLLLAHMPSASRRRLRRRVKPISLALLTTLFISVPYALWTGHYSYLSLLALRALDIMLLTLLALSRINLYSALSFSRSLSQLLVLSSSYILLYRRLFLDFLQALKSRSPEGIKGKEFVRFSEGVGGYFFERFLRDSEEVAEAMKSRGLDLD
jgi:cobalt/nickel transport system permease protein